jgi:2-methylcitrate dehydratase PrpD
VEIKRTDGTVLKSEQVRHARGDPRAPLSDDDLWTKFEDCVTWSKLKLDARKIFTQLHSLEKLASANDLFPRRASLKKRSRAK